MYDLGDRILMVASDRISTYDVVHPTPIPDKGAVLTGLSAFWFGAHRPHRPQPLHLGHRGRARRRPRPRDGRAQAADAARRVRRARLHHRLGLEGLPGHRQGLGHRAAARPARVRAPADADLHAVDEGRRGPRRGDRLRPRRRARRRPRPDGARARRLDRAVPVRRRARPRARRDPRRHEVRVRPRRRRRARRRRRGAHARLLALLAGRRLRARPGQPSFDKQYVRDWAAGSGWDKTPPAPELPDDVVAGTRERYVEAYERSPASPSPPGWRRTAA